MTDYETQLNDDDFIYYQDDKGEVRSGGFLMNSLALKYGLSPLSGGGGVNDTEFSQQFKDHIVPSFLHYQMAGKKEDSMVRDLFFPDEDEDEDEDTKENDNKQKGGDLYETLLNLVSFNKMSIKKQTRKQKIRKLSQPTKKNRK
jgi:hypothetical protein